MSLSAALNTAVFGLQTLQNQTRIVSGNVSNAQNPNYSRKITTLTTPVAEGLPQAALIASITRVAAPEIQQDLLASTGDLGRQEKQLQYTKELAEVLDATNTTGEQPTLLAMLTRFEDAWKQAEATPEDNDLKGQVVLRGVELTTEIRRLNGLQSELQNRAQQSLREDVDSINTSTIEIAKLNNKIAAQKASGAPIGDLEDLRDAEIAKLADKVGVRTILNDRGEVFVYTEGGVQLVGTSAQQFVYQPTAAPPGIYLQGTPPTVDVSAGFKNGSTRASLDYLDTSATAMSSSDPNRGTLAKFFNQLDSFSANLVTMVNAAYDDPATVAAEVYFTYVTPPATGVEAGNIQVDPLLVATPANLLSARAGAVQQSMRNTNFTAAQINPAADLNGLAISNVNIFGIANGIMAYHARSAAVNEADRDTSERIGHALDQKLRNQTGVNIDDELAQLQVLQNNYAALANVMSTVTQMFDVLVNIGR